MYGRRRPNLEVERSEYAPGAGEASSGQLRACVLNVLILAY